ncbi:MAG: hypothetical protein QXD48_00855 [Candidatus Aenigmatarchaeota archaeon]
MIEHERTFLAKFIPDGLKKCKKIEINDIYIPKNAKHPVLRIRRYGNKFEITKKFPIENDFSKQKEQTITLSKKEFQVLSKLDGKKLHKRRYFYKINGKIAEIDVFLGDLRGLVLVDFEFENEKEKKLFQMPDFCLADVTEEEFIAGGMLCGKAYKDIESKLKKFDYKKIKTNF